MHGVTAGTGETRPRSQWLEEGSGCVASRRNGPSVRADHRVNKARIVDAYLVPHEEEDVSRVA